MAAVTAAGGTISLLAGTVVLRLTLTGAYRRYVRVGMWPWLLAAGLAIVVLGAATLVTAMRHGPAEDAHGHGRRGEQRVGWLLLAPIAALLLVAPPPLGAYGVGRGAAVDVRAGAEGFGFGRLDPGDEPVPMTLLEFGQRSVDRDGVSFNGVAVRLTGFVAGAEHHGFLLARYEIACCAADAVPVVIRVVGVPGPAPPNDRWVTVTGLFRPGGGTTPWLAATAVAEVPAPRDPYE
ncbi:MAG TPA: TIGR03943 family protein [Actinomycetota bacterium]|nr:TIGR03943 family protein [Actinomycetota bacterium]